MTARSCATCRHLTHRPPERINGELERPEGHCCSVLFVVKRHRWQTPYWPGDIVTWSQAQGSQLETTVLVILDPEPFSCSAWNVDEREMPDRWNPIAEYDVRWNPFLGRYVRRERRAA